MTIRVINLKRAFYCLATKLTNNLAFCAEFPGLMNGDLSDPNKMSSLPIYATAAGSMNGHIAQNYYLTEGNDPSGSNETAQSDLWMMKNDMVDGQAEMQLPYHHYGTNGQMEANGYSYSYYPHEEYQQLDDTSNVSIKNALCEYNEMEGQKRNLINHYFVDSPYYDENPAVYGTTSHVGGQMLGDSSLLDPHNVDQGQMGQASGFDEDEYATHRSGRVIREIIV